MCDFLLRVFFPPHLVFRGGNNTELLFFSVEFDVCVKIILKKKKNKHWKRGKFDITVIRVRRFGFQSLRW